MSRWRELKKGEKPARSMEIRIPGDKQPLGVVVKVGPGEIKYRPHSGGALQVISANAEVEVKVTDDDADAAETKAKEKTTETKSTTTKETKPAKEAKETKPKAGKPKPQQLEIVKPKEEEEENGDEENEQDEQEENGEEDSEETDSGNDADDLDEKENENENENDDNATTPAVKGWMRIEELVEESGAKLGRILKARREGLFEGMTKSDPDYNGVGRKPLIYSPAALKVAMSLSSGSGGKGGRPKKGAKPNAADSTPTPARRGRPPGTGKRAVAKADISRSTSTPIKTKPSTTPAQSHLYAAGESLQTTLEGIDAEISRLTELKEKLNELWNSFAV